MTWPGVSNSSECVLGYRTVLRANVCATVIWHAVLVSRCTIYRCLYDILPNTIGIGMSAQNLTLPQFMATVKNGHRVMGLSYTL